MITFEISFLHSMWRLTRNNADGTAQTVVTSASLEELVRQGAQFLGEGITIPITVGP